MPIFTQTLCVINPKPVQAEELLNYLKDFLGGQLSFAKLETTFYMEFMDDYPEGGKFEDQFSEICEKMDYTDDDPDDESRKYGFINIQEFRNWLSHYILNQNML